MLTQTIEISGEEFDGYVKRTVEHFNAMADRDGVSITTIYAMRSLYGSVAYLEKAIDAVGLIEMIDRIKNRLMSEQVEQSRGKSKQ